MNDDSRHDQAAEPFVPLDTIPSPQARKAHAGSGSTGSFHPAESTPGFIGRHRIVRVLGEGGFGRVYLARDEELKRDVAIKVPNAERLSHVNLEEYRTEARVLASLDHPHIVPVYDIGSTPEFPCYIVSKYIAGHSLAERLEHSRLAYNESAKLVATVAEALHYAHKKGLVHRDVKPGNILIDGDGRPCVVDFGLALRDVDLGRGSGFAGTPAYMSPEQARGEGHRVDGRSDIFSLGVVLYELLTARRPFRGPSQADLLLQITSQEARPPRQIDDGIPAEFERICLKMLTKRSTDRYTTAKDVADDLLAFLQDAQPAVRPGPAQQQPEVVVDTPLPADTPAPLEARKPPPIVPKGLRSFDQHDSEFFLELVPGPRDRYGLPESLRFWKSRIEENDLTQTFSVGLIHGPSGCGKSSLVKAGLIPHLAPEVRTIYVEATADDTELRVCRGLRNLLGPAGPGGETLPPLTLEAAGPELVRLMAELRRGAGGKTLIVLDQFEQWLTTRHELATASLVSALRQCDGQHVQAVVMIRDDFYGGVNRFFQHLDVPLQEGRNQAFVDLFDLPHARKVLAAFGDAYGRLGDGTTDPTNPTRKRGNTTPPQDAFLNQVVEGLAEEGKVISVRLALFAEMVKSRPWTEQTLREIGGVSGVGVTFLEETFAAKSAPASYRRHAVAARKVLHSLLPEAGSAIKGHSRSEAELCDASGYAARPADVADLLRLLDSELRLITPIDDDATVSSSTSESPTHHAPPDTRFFQLTHDYLVPALSEWLTRKQRETRRGRAELRLAERAAHWNAKPENRHLPSLGEFCNIRLLTSRKNWTQPQQKMMRKARRVHGWRAGITATMLILFAVTGVTIRNAVVADRERIRLENERKLAARTLENDRKRAESLVAAVLAAPAEAVPYAIQNLQPLQALANPILQQRFADASRAQRLHAALALAEFGSVDAEFLVASIEWAGGGICRSIVAALRRAPNGQSILRTNFESAKNPNLRARLAITNLHLGETKPTETMLALGPDPTERTALIHGLDGWHADIADYAKPLRESRDSAFRSGLVLAVGRVPVASLSAVEKRTLMPVLLDLFHTGPDGATHSAADWTLRQWEIPLPRVLPATAAPANRDWYVNSLGMTFVKIPAGTFGRVDELDEFAAPKVKQTVILTKPFFLSNREVTLQQFQEFMEDRAAEKPKDWRGVAEGVSPTGDHPVQRVSWYDAVMFCNWLSAKEGLQPCYERTGEKEVDNDGKPTAHDAWRLLANANGYQLPTEAQWEYACRARAQTDFCYGDDGSLLDQYAVYAQSRAGTCGNRLPNAFGLFDMHGNVFEWCLDLYGNDDEQVEDPVGPSKGSRRGTRGGSWGGNARYCRSQFRISLGPPERSVALGFRLASVPSSK